jgi:3-oxoacyl-[acyl-carrier protein] reductase
MKKLEGKVAVVTGASKGIGASIAKHLAAEGASVVVNYASSKKGADIVVEEITKAGGKAIAVGANVANKAEIDQLFAQTKQAYGHVDILVNNAGIYDFKPLDEITEEHFHSIFNLNVLGLILTTQAAVKLFTEKGGSVINISSIVGRSAFPGATVYSATKGAVNSITQALSKELGPKKIRVNGVGPGMVETEGTASKGITGEESEMKKMVVAQTPIGRIGLPQDIGTVVTFLASDDSAWVSGETWYVAGGYQ